jgi:hypothetical protein
LHADGREITELWPVDPCFPTLDIDALSGDEVQAEVAKAYATPPAIIERTRQALIYKSR